MSVPHVYTAISAVTAHLAKEGIAKDRQNKQQGYAYRGIDQVYSALSVALTANNLVVIPRVLTREVSERESKHGGVLFTVVCDVEFDLVSTVDGSKHVGRAIGEAMDSADKATNKAMSVAYKYFAFMVFCIPVEGEEDADAVTHSVAPRQEPQRPVQWQEPAISKDDYKSLFGTDKDAGRKMLSDYTAWAKGLDLDPVAFAGEAWQAGCRSLSQIYHYQETGEVE